MVIEGQLSDLSNKQRIRVSKTVSFDADRLSDPVDNALVSVRDNQGLVYKFAYREDGYYDNTNFLPIPERTYHLDVLVEDQHYEASCYMPVYTEVDSLGIVEEEFFGDTYYFATFKFYDNVEEDNYFIYEISINDNPFKFAMTTSDKFNNGQYVTHRIRDRDEDLKWNDRASVRRYAVSQPVYAYWNEFQMNNPGSAAPSNPTSNMSNGALGYFSVASAKEYEFVLNY